MFIQPNNYAYHYTSVDTLVKLIEGILEDNFIFHASYITSMNDPTELRYGLSFTLKYLREIEEELKIENDFKLSNLFEENTIKEEDLWNLTKQFKLPFIVSFSNRRDFLPQWVNYGDEGKGVSIGFDIQDYYQIYEEKDGRKIIDISKYDEKEPHAIKVLYNRIAKRHPYVLMLNNLYKLYNHQIVNANDKNDIIKYGIITLHHAVSILSALIKHSAFEYENESRILCCINDINEVRFKTNPKGLCVPYMEVGISKSKLKRIIIGPKCDYESTRLYLTCILKQHGLNNVKISKSVIPYR